MKKRVLMICNALYLPGEGGYKREMYLFDLLKKEGYSVTLLTADFNHYAKATRDISDFYNKNPNYKDILFIHVLPYKKNISLKRILSEKKWSNNVAKWIKNNIENYDVVYGEMPDSDTNIKVRKICNKYDKKFIIDIRDLRPEAFHVLIKNNLLYNILTFPIKIKANRAYACADEFVAVSKTYLERGLKANNRSKNPLVVYLGGTYDRFFNGVKQYRDSIEKKDNEFWVIYAGTLGSSYDLITLLEAAKILKNDCKYNIKFKILGQGPEREKLEKYAIKHGLSNVEFLGFVSYEKMAAYLSKSDITINAVKRTASQSIINKVADYLIAGIPMLNSCTSIEQVDMIDEYKVGLNYLPEDFNDLAKKIIYLYQNSDIREEYGKNAKELALEKFDRAKTHYEILELIDKI